MKDLESTVNSNRAYYEGAQAYYSGKPRERNGYPRSSFTYHNAWNNGWDDAKERHG